MVQALNVGSTAWGEALPPGQPRFPHLEMGRVTLNPAGLLQESGFEAE